MAEPKNPLDDIVAELVVFKNHDGTYNSNHPMWMDSRIQEHWMARHSDEALAAAGEQDEEDEDEVPDYNAWTNDDLRAELVERKLSVDGKKADMVARLEADDAK